MEANKLQSFVEFANTFEYKDNIKKVNIFVRWWQLTVRRVEN